MYSGPKLKQKEIPKAPLIQTASPSRIQPGSLLADDINPSTAQIESPRKKKFSRKEKPEEEKKKKKSSKPRKPKPLVDLSEHNGRSER
jgi:hypothetical protein